MPRHTGSLRQSSRPTAALTAKERERNRRRARLQAKVSKTRQTAAA